MSKSTTYRVYYNDNGKMRYATVEATSADEAKQQAGVEHPVRVTPVKSR